MIRETNFAPSRRQPVLLVKLVLLGVVCALGLGLFWAVERYQQHLADTEKLRAHETRLQAAIAVQETDARNTPSLASLTALNDRVAFFNRLSGPRHPPLLALLAELETLVPEDVWLSQMTYDAEKGRLTLSLQSEDETDLPRALSKLEGSAMLANVLLERQLRVQSGTSALVQYDVEASVP